MKDPAEETAPWHGEPVDDVKDALDEAKAGLKRYMDGTWLEPEAARVLEGLVEVLDEAKEQADDCLSQLQEIAAELAGEAKVSAHEQRMADKTHRGGTGFEIGG